MCRSRSVVCCSTLVMRSAIGALVTKTTSCSLQRLNPQPLSPTRGRSSMPCFSGSCASTPGCHCSQGEPPESLATGDLHLPMKSPITQQNRLTCVLFHLKIELGLTEIGCKEPGCLEQRKSKLCWPTFFNQCFLLFTLISVSLGLHSSHFNRAK